MHRCEAFWSGLKLFPAGLVLVVSLFSAGALRAQESEKSTAGEFFKDVKLGCWIWVDYSIGEVPRGNGESESYNRFKITRSYLDARKTILPWFKSRLTIDVNQEDDGDYDVRAKFVYAEFLIPDFGLLTDISSQVGLGQMPWLHFENQINPYRCQENMAAGRAGVFNSADVGISVQGNFGGASEHVVGKTGNSRYNGRYGSWKVGVYNGGGYHEVEQNENKVIEGRISARPLAQVLPGLQVSYFGAFGKGNAVDTTTGEFPDYIVNLGMLSFELPDLDITAQYFVTEGNALGDWVDDKGEALTTEGYSAFARVRMFDRARRLSVFGRVDHVDVDKDNVLANKSGYTMYIGGSSYDLFKDNMIILLFESTDYDANCGGRRKLPETGAMLGDDYRVQMVLQMRF